jgi:hypothetical protein
MRGHLSAVVIAIGLLTADVRAYAATTDEFCHQLQMFERASFTKADDGKPIRRLATFVWFGRAYSENMRFGCQRQKSDAASATFCTYLVRHAPMEFRTSLPERVLGCYGQAVAKQPEDRGVWQADIDLRGFRHDRSVHLHIDLGSDGRDDEVGFAIVPDIESPKAGLQLGRTRD